MFNDFISGKRNADSRYRYTEQDRIEIYKFVINTVREKSDTEIALCKETSEIWSAVGLKLEKGKSRCHCYV